MSSEDKLLDVEKPNCIIDEYLKGFTDGLNSQISTIDLDTSEAMVFSFNFDDYGLDGARNLYEFIIDQFPNNKIVMLPDNASLSICSKDLLKNYIDKISKISKSIEEQESYDMEIKTLKDTVELMTSNDYKDRFIAEYKQLVIRHKGLINMVDKWDKGELLFKPTCSREIYDLQLRAMEDYIAVLEARAEMEKIIL